MIPNEQKSRLKGIKFIKFVNNQLHFDFFISAFLMVRILVLKLSHLE